MSGESARMSVSVSALWNASLTAPGCQWQRRCVVIFRDVTSSLRHHLDRWSKLVYPTGYLAYEPMPRPLFQQRGASVLVDNRAVDVSVPVGRHQPRHCARHHAHAVVRRRNTTSRAGHRLAQRSVYILSLIHISEPTRPY